MGDGKWAIVDYIGGGERVYGAQPITVYLDGKALPREGISKLSVFSDGTVDMVIGRVAYVGGGFRRVHTGGVYDNINLLLHASDIEIVFRDDTSEKLVLRDMRIVGTEHIITVVDDR